MFKNIALVFIFVYTSTSSYLEYEMLHYAPYGTRLFMNQKEITTLNEIKGNITCSLNTSITKPLLSRIVHVMRPDHRLGPYFYSVLFCLNVSMVSWVKRNDCEFYQNFYLKRSVALKKKFIYLMECKYNSKVYAAELNITKSTVITIINGGNRFSLSFLQFGETISCLNRDIYFRKNIWVKSGSTDPLTDPLTVNETSYQCPVKSKVDIQTFNCLRSITNSQGSTRFFIQACFNFKFISDHGETRLNNGFDAGEKISCGQQSIKTSSRFKNFFNPTFPPQVILKKDNKNIKGPALWLEIPELQKDCKTCELVCILFVSGKIHYYNTSQISIDIITNYLTLLESQNNKDITYYVPFKCNTSHYPKGVITVAVKETNLYPPYSFLIQNSKNEKMKSEKDGWLTIEYNEYQNEKYIWMIFCEISDPTKISTPKIENLKSKYENLTLSLYYPQNVKGNYTLNGFIYRCQGFKKYRASLIAFSGSANLKYIEGNNYLTSYVQIHSVYQFTEVKLICLGSKSLFDKKPTEISKTLYIYPSQWKKRSEFIIYGQNLSCEKQVTFGTKTISVFYNIEVHFEQNQKKWMVRSDIDNGRNYVQIKSDSPTDLKFKYCCINVVNSKGEVKCPQKDMLSMNIITSVKVTFNPNLRENIITYLDMGTQLSCKVCGDYQNNQICFDRNNLELKASMHGRNDQVIKGKGILKIPYFKANNAKENIADMKMIFSCILDLDGSKTVRHIRLKSCSKDITILPEEKTLFRINESVECSTRDLICQETALFTILIITEGVITTKIDRGMTVTLTWKHAGKNIVKCSFYDNKNVSIKRQIIVVTPPKAIEIFNYKKILTVGESMLCDGWSNPSPSKNWWFVDGPGFLQVKYNRLIVMPNTKNGLYLYECEIQNFHGRLKKSVKFQVFNKYEASNCNENFNFEFFIVCLVVLVIFVLLFFFFLWLFNDNPVITEENEF